jgi:uroporphyrinogen decarboxylase
MAAITSRERVQLALAHCETDRIPIDFGGRISGIALLAYEELKSYLGIWKKSQIDDKRLQLAKVDPEVLELFNVDTRYIYPNAPQTWDPREEGNSYFDEWGMRMMMPANKGYYYDYVDYPIKSPTAEGIKDHQWPDVRDLSRITDKEEEASTVFRETPYALVTTLRGVFEQTWPLRGLQNFLLDLVEYPGFCEELLVKVLQIQKAIYGPFLESVGRYLDLLCFTDDLGTQMGPMISPDMYRRVIKPMHRELISFFKNLHRG